MTNDGKYQRYRAAILGLLDETTDIDIHHGIVLVSITLPWRPRALLVLRIIWGLLRMLWPTYSGGTVAAHLAIDEEDANGARDSRVPSTHT